MDRIFVGVTNALMGLHDNALTSLEDDERGASGVEYGIMVAAIAAVIVALAVTLGTEIQAAFQTVVDAI